MSKEPEPGREPVSRSLRLRLAMEDLAKQRAWKKGWEEEVVRLDRTIKELEQEIIALELEKTDEQTQVVSAPGDSDRVFDVGEDA